MKLSVVIPVHNEEVCIEKVVGILTEELESKAIEHEIVLVNDNSTDSTPQALNRISSSCAGVKLVTSYPPRGFGKAIRSGLDNATGDVVVIFMGDGSDDAADVVKYYHKILEGYDCVFGSRFVKGSQVAEYPKIKLILNRLGNKLIQLLFFMKYNDVSNAFKAYRIEVIKAIQPLISQYFNITVEMPLKAITRGFSYAVVPINWSGRGSGVSKYHIRELSKKYFFSILYVWLEKILLKEEIRKPGSPSTK
jgi:dolichol-phosphate mannosyltransferase